MDDNVLQKSVLKDYGEVVSDVGTLLFGVSVTDFFTNVTETVNGDGTANWVFGDVTSLMRFASLGVENGTSLKIKARVRKNSGSGAFTIDYGDGAQVDISGQFVDSTWTVVETTLVGGAGGFLDFPSNGNYNGYDIDVDYISIHDSVGGSDQVVDLSEANIFNTTLTSDVTFTFANPPASGTAGGFTLILVQDATGGRTVTWPAAVRWSGGTEPTLYTIEGSLNIFSFLTVDGGTTWFGFNGGGKNREITFVGSAGGSYTLGGTRTVTLPSGMQEDDLCLVLICNDQPTEGEVTTIPSGWTERLGLIEPGGLFQLLYKVQTSSVDTSVDIALPGTPAADFGIITVAYRGVDTSTPFDVTDTTASNTSGDPDSPSITPTSNGCMILSAGVLDDDVITEPTPPSGYVLAGWADASEASGSNAVAMIAHKLQTTAGAEDPGVWGTTGDDSWDAATLALRPAP